VNASEHNIYIQSATLNGAPYNKSYLQHRDLMAGGELVFQMGPRANPHWGSGRGREPISRIDAPRIVPVPVIQAGGQTFRGRLEINISGIGTLHYTIDGREPGVNSPKFTRPFFIDGDTAVKAVAITPKMQRSSVVTATYHRIPHDWKISLGSSYSSQYTGGGDFALIDGIRGSANWSGGRWQGYQGRDLVAVLDLGEVQSVSKVGAGFLQDAGSWIWMPRRVEIELSIDGRTFSPAISIANEVSEKQEGVVTKDFVKTIAPQMARYVRLRAVNFGKIPAWHPGSGGDTWIFVDEIMIEK